MVMIRSAGHRGNRADTLGQEDSISLLLEPRWWFHHQGPTKGGREDQAKPEKQRETLVGESLWFKSWIGKFPWKGIGYPLQYFWAFLMAYPVKNLPAMWETWVQSLGWEYALEKGMATHSSILAWRIP